MKLIELGVITVSQRRFLGRYANMEVEDYLNEIGGKINSGQSVNKFFRELYDDIITRYPEKNHDYADSQDNVHKNPLLNELRGISIDEMEFYVDSDEFRKNCGSLKRKGIKTLEDLYLFEYAPKPLQAYKEAAKKWQCVLKNKTEVVITEWKEANIAKCLPQTIDVNSTLIENIDKAVTELINLLMHRKASPKYARDSYVKGHYATILDKYYNGKKSPEEIAPDLDLTTQRVIDIKNEILRAFFSGQVISTNLRINQSLIDAQKRIAEDCVLNREEKLLDFLGKSNDRIVYDLLGYDFVDVVEGIRFVVPKDTKGIYTKISESFLYILRAATVPLDQDTIIESIEQHPKVVKENKEFDVAFVENLLRCEDLIEKVVNSEQEEPLYRIRSPYLSSKEQRLIRIIYDYREPINLNYAKEIYEQKYNEKCTTNTSALRKAGFNCVSGNKWQYGEKLESIKGFIENYIDEKEIFYYTDLVSILKEKGYFTENEKTIRAYITNICSVDTADRLHFCHKDKVEDYSGYNWRNSNRDGLTNWILNRIKDVLLKQQSATLDELYDTISEAAKDTDFEFRIQQRIKYTIDKYSGLDYPFTLDNGLVRKNSPIFEKTNFEIIGLKGGKYPFYIQIRSIITNEIKKIRDGRISLIDAIKLINETLDECQTRSTIIRALNNKHLPSINVKLENIDGTVYIIRTEDLISTEPVYEIKPSENIEEEAVATDVTELVEKRVSISYRLELDWKKLQNALTKELGFYRSYLKYEHIDDYENAIKHFVVFLQHSRERNLREQLPRDLYEYFFAQTDYYDRNKYLCNLLLFYEALLRELYYKMNGNAIKTKGLGELSMNFPWMARIIRFLSDRFNGFERIFKELYNKRNKVAHGESLDLSSVEIAKAIADYIALFIMTVAKYDV